MKKTLTILTILVMVFAYACKDDEPVTNNTSQTGFDIGNVHYVSTNTTDYQTDFGQILKVTGANFELTIVLSDNDNKTFAITDTLTGLDSGKARCIFFMNNDFRFSTSGTVEYDAGTKSGTFTVNTEGLDLKNGQIKVNTVVNQAIVDFTGLTERDITGVPLNAGDINDWFIRTDWEIVERLVFNLKTLTTLTGSAELFEYPNPFTGSLIMNLGIPQESIIDFYLVNANFEIEQIFRGLQPGNVSLLLDNEKYKGNYYRLYYKVYTDSAQLYGTGDLKVNE